MILFTLFKSAKKEAERVAVYPLSLMGKLPCEADFIRQAISHPEATLFDQWLDAGFQHLVKSGKQHYPPYFETIYCYIKCPGAPFFGLGGLYASYDKSGRHYPWMILSWESIQTAYFDFMPFVPACYLALWDELEEFNIHVMSERSLLTRFTKHFSTLERPTTNTDVLGKMMQSVSMPIAQFILNWDAPLCIAQALQAFLAFSTFRQKAFFFPLPTHLNAKQALTYVIFWLQLCEHCQIPWFQVFWSYRGESPFVCIHTDTLQGELLGWLISPEVRSQTLQTAQMTGKGQFGLLPKTKQWLENERESVCQLLHLIMREIR